jgi:hypothetical protein
MKTLICSFVGLVLVCHSIKSQDSLQYITSACLGNPQKADETCPNGINFQRESDTLKIYGQIDLTCASGHLVTYRILQDSIYITSIDTGLQANCICRYCFSIKISEATTDTVIQFNGVNYNVKKNMLDEVEQFDTKSISIIPNPSGNDFVVYMGDASGKESHIEVYATDGSIIQSSKIANSVKSFSIKNLQRGVYIIRIKRDDTTLFQQKIIKE